jgi:peptidoglycan lytic transglycosylase
MASRVTLRIAAALLAASLTAPSGAAAFDHSAIETRAFVRSEFRVRAGIPEEALRALRENRFFHASLLMRAYLATVKDTTAEELLVSARAEAGWGDWERVETLLANRAWLDRIEGGDGWQLLGRSLYEADKYEASATALARYLDVASESPATSRGFAELYRALALTHLTDTAAATSAFDRAAALLPDISDWIVLRLVESAAERGDAATVTSRLSKMDPEIAREWGWRARVEAYRNANDIAAALEAASNAAAAMRSSSRKAEAYVAAAGLYQEQGDLDKARDSFRKAMSASPGSTSAVDAARLMSDLSGLTPDDRLQIGRIYLRHGNTARAVAGISAYLNAGKGSATERERLRYEMGNAQFRGGRYDDAEKTMLGIVERNIVPSLAADALLIAGRAQYRDGRVTQGRKTFISVVSRYPKDDAAARALYLAADLDQDDENFSLAQERFRKTTTLSPNAEEVGLAHMRLGGIAFADSDFKAALAEFDGYRTRYPNGRRYVQATYWAALSARRLRDEAKATARLEEVFRMEPLSYYGGRAADMLGKTFWDVPLKPSPDTDPSLVKDVTRALQRVDLLQQIDGSDAADWEVDRIRQRFGVSKSALYSLAEQLNQRGYTMTAIGIGWELFDRDGGWNGRLLHIIYPFPYQNIIMAESAEAGVDPFLSAGLMRQESMFNVDAISGPGAIGLMQVMPATGETLAHQLGVKRFDTDMLKNAELNTHLGTRYLAEQLTDFDRRLPVVLAAYNAGPHRIDRWQQFPEYADDDLFAERIPFAETRDYVKIVQNNARIYRALYQTTMAPPAGS